MRRMAWCCWMPLVLACQPGQIRDERTSGSSDQMYIPGVSDAPSAGGQNSNPPMKPLQPNVTLVGSTTYDPAKDGLPQVCNSDSDCGGTFSHCVKDVPEEVGICSRECASTADCGSQADWLCIEGRWSLTSEETRQLCALTCVLSVECPRGTSCNDGYCGTPCAGGNCGAEVKACESHQALDCVGDAVTWYNSCAEPEETHHVCNAGESCLWGVCISASTGQPTQGPVVGVDGSCGGELRRCGSASTVLVTDGCGNTVSSEACTGGKECSAGLCRCMPTSQSRCQSGKLWRLDSCGNMTTIIGSC